MAALGTAASHRNTIARLIQLGIEVMSNHRSSYGRLTRAATLFALVLASTGIAMANADTDATSSASAAAASKAADSPVTYTYQTRDYPGASLTILWGINDFGELAGQYAIGNGTSHAMVYSHGQFKPLAPDVLGNYFSAAGGPNDYGATFGGYADASGLQHGFLIQGGHLATIDFPGHLNSNLDQVNMFGAIAGVYWDADGIYHGILRQGQGFDTPINVAGARDTYPLGILGYKPGPETWLLSQREWTVQHGRRAKRRQHGHARNQ
jgi:hypothetical protein